MHIIYWALADIYAEDTLKHTSEQNNACLLIKQDGIAFSQLFKRRNWPRKVLQTSRYNKSILAVMMKKRWNNVNWSLESPQSKSYTPLWQYIPPVTTNCDLGSWPMKLT